MELPSIAAFRFPAQLPAVNRAWAIGQLLDVTVIGATGRNSTALRIGGTTIESTTPVPFSPGTRLSARVVALQPVPLLEARPADEARTPETAAAQSLRGLLPRKLDPGPAWQALAADVRELSDRKPESVAPEVLRAARNLVQRVPDLRALASAATLQSAVALDGQALEASLARAVATHAPVPPVDDRKWQLLEVLAQFRSPTQPRSPVASADSALGRATPATEGLQPAAANVHLGREGEATAAAATEHDLKRKVEGLLAHMTTRQIQTAAAAEAGHVYGMLELPVRLEDQTTCVQFEYEREHVPGHGADETPHALLVVVPLPGPTELRVRLSAIGDHLSVVAWAPDPELQRKLMNERERLASRLTACGFEIGDVVVAPLASPRDDAFLPRGLVDTRA